MGLNNEIRDRERFEFSHLILLLLYSLMMEIAHSSVLTIRNKEVLKKKI